MLSNIATGDGIKDFAVEMGIFVVGDNMKNWETHWLVFQHVNAGSFEEGVFGGVRGKRGKQRMEGVVKWRKNKEEAKGKQESHGVGKIKVRIKLRHQQQFSIAQLNNLTNNQIKFNFS